MTRKQALALAGAMLLAGIVIGAEWVKPASAYGNRGLSRQEVTQAVRDALREVDFASRAEVRQAVAETLRGCRLKGQRRRPADGDADQTDFTAYFSC
ncbi:MAG: hypothetical protein Tsb0016_15650 [Sphingomonadales bacterium]